MLQILHIENIAVIERADIEFHPGFNALTGETGAGKSIVIDALGAVLGQRTSRDLIRTGAQEAMVSAAFDNVPPDLAGLSEQGVAPDEDGNLLLQRTIHADGKNVCRANGRPITVSQLRAVGSALLNIHGQHDGQQLLDEEQHRVYLDRCADVEAELAAFAADYEALTKTRARIRSLEMDEGEKARRIDSLRYQIAELEEAALESGEEERLCERRGILQNAERYTDAVGSASYYLNGGDDSVGAVSQLREAERALGGAGNISASFEEILERLKQVTCEAYDLAETVRDLKDDFSFSPEELDRIESRLSLLARLKKRYGATVEDMQAYLARSQKELDEIAFADDTLARLRGEEAAQLAAAKKSADVLSQKRRAAAKKLEARILRELTELDMPRMQFSVEFSEKEFDATGGDHIRFLMSANMGEELKPINRVASGGELARVMLALKNVLAEKDHVATMVFDEVDTGVSGRAAQRVAEKLAAVSRNKQVLCVTHLPQLAAMADTHFSVEKGERGGRTYTRVVCMDRAQRAAELARITGGSHVTDALLASAEELLTAAEEFKKSL